MKAPDLLVSTNDAKYQRVLGEDTFLADAGSDTLDVIDASSFPPRVVASVAIATTIAGPPQAVAISPDGRYVVVSAPSRYDADAGRCIFENHLQLVDLQATPPRVVDRVPTSHHPQGVAFHPRGDVLLAATVGGTVEVFVLLHGRLARTAELPVSSGRLAGVAFTDDGAAALVALRDEQGLAVLESEGTRVRTTPERITTGISPYAIDVAGRWAVVGNVGLAGRAGNAGQMAADSDTLTLVDLARRPFRAVQHLTVPALPEGVAISPDSRWIAALTMDGSNLRIDNPLRREQGRVVLFELRDGQAFPAGDLPAGAAGQGIAFAADSRTLLVQFNVEQELAVFAVEGGTLVDTGHRVARPGGPVSIRARPARGA